MCHCGFYNGESTHRRHFHYFFVLKASDFSLLFLYTVLDRRRGKKEGTEMRPFISSFESSGILLNQSHVNFIFVALIFFPAQASLGFVSSRLQRPPSVLINQRPNCGHLL